jgi:hypothetical protein
MALTPCSHRFGPDNASLQIKTYRGGVAAKAGHDLIIDVTRWEATLDLDGSTVELSADSRSLQVREGLRGVKPLTDKDRADIRSNIDDEGPRRAADHVPLELRPAARRRLVVEGDLTMAGSTRPITAQLDLGDDGRLSGVIPLTQSAWAIKLYRG